jgi:hypothetical protein
MTYGDQLDFAAAALARAYAALRDPPPDAAGRASAAMSRTSLYRGLERQAVAVGRIHPNQLPPLGQLPQARPRAVDSDPVAQLAIGLRHAVAMSAIAGRTTRIDLPTTGPVAVALSEAAEALRVAGDILASNTGPHTHPTAAHQPLTSEGMAILAGVGAANNLAAVAQLVAAAAIMDRRLSRWLHPDDAPGDLEPLLDAAAQDAARTGKSALITTAHVVVSAGQPSMAPTLGMTVAPPVDDPHRWSALSSTGDCVEAIDAARSWLIRHGDRLTIGQLAATTAAALAIIHHIAHVYAGTTPGFAFTGEDAATALPWRTALAATTDLRSPAPAVADHTTLKTAATSVAAWLREQLRPEGHWLGPIYWAPTAAAKSAWRHDAQQLAARLPDLADLLHDAINTARDRGSVLAPTGQLNQRPGNLIHRPQWGPVPPDHPTYRSLLTGLRGAAANGRAFATAIGAQPRSGLADVRRKRPSVPAASRLASQWYPQQSSTQPIAPIRVSQRASDPRRPGRVLPSADQARRRR